MSVIDIVLGALILFGLIRGLMKGLFVEVASLVALIAGVYGAIHFGNFAGDILQTKVDWDEKNHKYCGFCRDVRHYCFDHCIGGKSANQIS